VQNVLIRHTAELEPADLAVVRALCDAAAGPDRRAHPGRHPADPRRRRRDLRPRARRRPRPGPAVDLRLARGRRVV